MEPASYPPPHSCHFCQQFVLEFGGGEAANSSNHDLVDRLKDERVRAALQTRGFLAPGLAAMLRRYYVFDVSVTALESSQIQTCALADLLKKNVPEASDGSDYPREQIVFAAEGPLHENNISLGTLEIFEYPPIEPESKGEVNISVRSFAIFDVLKALGDTTSKHFGLDPANMNPRSEFTHKLARSWLTTCLGSHKSCPKPSKTWMPTRLLRISRASPPGGLRLQLYETEPGVVEPYGALTYCWGGSQPVLTKKGNREEHLAGIDIEKLPKTLQDVLTVTEELGLSFVWVDALCIIEDDDEDKAIEIARMAPVYRNATIVIGACRARTVMEGFLGPRLPLGLESPEAVFQMRCRGPDGEDGSVILVPETLPLKEPIDERAWTLQERLLSFRYLEYGTLQTQWFCQGVDSDEALVDGFNRQSSSNVWKYGGNPQFMATHSLLRSPTRPFTGDYKPIDLWEGLVIVHTHRQLGVPTDLLPSLAGIAPGFAEAMRAKSEDYLCGLWKKDLPRMLLWENTHGPCSARPAQFIAPSWSWATNNVGTQFRTGERGSWERRFKRQTHESFELLGSEVQLADERSPFGAVLSGSLKLRGVLKSAEWDRSGDIPEFKFPGMSKRITDISIQEDEDQSESCIPVSFLVVLEAPSHCVEGLVLRQKDGGHFVRLGTFCYFHERDEGSLAQQLWSQNPEPQVIELV